MKIGIIVAMQKELNLLMPIMTNQQTKTIDGFTLHLANIATTQVCAMQCGIGKVNAALGCRALIQDFAPDLIINTGVAGGTGQEAKVSDIVAATSVAYHDVWCGPGTTWGQAADCPPKFPGNKTAIDILSQNPNIKFGTIASGDIFVDQRATVDHVLNLYPDALAVDMESGAIAQTCHRLHTPFICLRVLSDTPGEVANNGAQYESFWDDAPAETFSTIRQLINSL